MRRNEARPTNPQPTSRKRKLSALTNNTIAKIKKLRKEKKRQKPGSSSIYPAEYIWIISPIPVTNINIPTSAEDGDDNSQANDYLGRGNGEHEKDKHLTVRRVEFARYGHKR